MFMTVNPSHDSGVSGFVGVETLCCDCAMCDSRAKNEEELMEERDVVADVDDLRGESNSNF